MRKIIYTRPDGGLSVVHPVINTHPPENITEAEAEQRAWDRLPVDAIGPQWVDSVPTDRTFRNAWVAVEGRVDHDMSKAREIHKEALRSLRTPKLAALDVEYQRADEQGDTAKKQEIAAKKQSLRDATKHPAIVAAQTVEELKAAVPDDLVA